MKGWALFTTIAAFLLIHTSALLAQTMVNGPVTGYIVSCEGTASASPGIEQFTVAGSNLKGNITLAAPAYFELSLSAGNGYANSLVLPQARGTAGSTIVYVRSSASAQPGTLTGSVLITSPGAASLEVPLTGFISALATVNPVADQIVGNGISTGAVHFTGTGNYFQWVNDTPGIGLPASGSGDIPSFIPMNNSSKPITATVTVTPYFAGSVYVGNDVFRDVTVINSITNKVTTRIKVGTGPESIAVRPDGSLVYVGNFISGTISIISTKTNTVIATVPANITPWGICVTPDGSRIYVAGAYGEVLVIDALTYSTLAEIKVGIYAQGIAASPDGKYVYVAGEINEQGKGVVFMMSTANNTMIATIPVDIQPGGIAVTPDGSQVYTSNYWSNTVSAINTATKKVAATIYVGINPNGIDISPDGKLAYVGVENENAVYVISTATNTLTRQIPVGRQPFGVSVTPDGSTIYVVNAYTCNVSVIDAASSKVTDSIPLEGYMYGPASMGKFVSAGMCSGNPIKFTITVNPVPPPVITVGSEPGPLTTTYGTPSAPASFTVSAANLHATVLVSPPSGFEVSADGKTFASQVTIGQGLGFGATPVYIRLTATTPVGNYSGNIVLSSTGATAVDAAMPVSTVTPAPLTISADDKIKVYLSANPPLTASYLGFVNGETIAALSAPVVLITTAVDASPIGQYPITAGGAAASNYAITYVPGVLTIVKSLSIPNTFTPNGDGINDTWNIKALEAYSNCSVDIFSRWGSKVYTSIGYAVPWDGRCKGAPLPPGTYYYIIDLKNGTDHIAGFVTIVR